MTRARSSLGFTLLEICIVIALAVMLFAAAVPSLSGQMARRRLQDSYDRLDSLVSQARQHAMKEGKPYLLAWNKEGVIQLFPADLNLEARRKQGATVSLFPNHSDEQYTLFRPSALTPQPSAEWTFWPSGTCEPVIVKFKGKSGEWEAAYNALSARGNLSRFIAL